MHRLFILPLKSLPLKLGAFALSALFILAACGGAPISFDINLNGLDSQCIANPFLKGCDKHGNSIKTYRQLIIKDCTDNPSKSSTDLCIAAEGATNPPSDNENGAVVEEVVDNTPKDIEIKPELDKDSSTKTDKEKGETTSLEIVDLCSDPANANNERCSPAVINCINNPFSGSCQGDNLLGNFVRGGVTVSKTVVLQDKRAVDCRDGNIDRAQCQTLNSEKQRCTGAAFSDASCSAVAYSVCKADAFDPLCGEKENFAGVYFNERSEVCFEDPNNPNCTGLNGHVAVVCSEYPFDRLCTGNTDYDDARADACEANPGVSSSCPVAPVPEVADVCLDNPFGPTCADSSYNNARKDLAKTCAIQAVTGAVTSACSTIIAEALPCFINPFDTVCDSNPAVRSYIAQLRSTRVAFCKNSTGLFDHLIAPLCTGAPVAKSVCRIDPFDTVCLGDSAYAGDRLSACRDDSSNQRCSNIIAGVCRNDPFDTLCGSDYNDDRANFCRNSVEPLYRCLKVEDRVCATNPLDSLCSSSIYADARINACRNDQSNPSCRTIIANLCHRDNNPFDSLCGSSYNGIRESVCASNPNSSRCSDTLTRVCGGNPFNRLCRNTQTYLDTRVSICRGNPADGRCSWTIGSICRDDPFDSLCGGGYNNARETACRNGSNNTQCGNVIAGVCSGNPFDPLCGNGYTGERETACRNGSTNTQCGNIVAGVCSGNPFDPLCGSGYTQNRRSLCTDDPFTPRCAGDVYNDLRVSFCEDNVGTHPECPAPTPQVTAALWENSFDEELASAANGRDHGGKFLKGRAADLDNGGLREFDANHVGTLTFANATFNGRPLGGDATDGTAVFVTERSPYGTPSYAAILSGTNLGAPLTQTEGTAQWIGAFQYSGSGDHDFILTVTFGGTDKAGSISAFVKGYREVTHNKDFLVEGDFDNAGLITGTVRLRHFYDDYYTDNRPNTRYLNTVDTSELTGLIGEEGAVGVFTGDFSSSPVIGFSGGFVARPASEQELAEVAETCVDDPFKSACSVGYEDERHAVVELCITGDNALNEELCGSANEWYSCIKNPFDSYCSSSFAKYNRPARVNRVAFCRNADNADNALCTDEDAYSYICRIYPFDAQCLGDGDYDQTRQDACTIAGAGSTQCELLAGLTCGSNPFSSYCGGGYNDVRETACRNGSTNTQCGGIIAGVCGGNPFDPLCGSGYTQSRRSLCTDNPFAPRCTGEVYNDLRVTFCDKAVNADNPACPTPQVTAKVWADSFDTPLATEASLDHTESQFLIGGATDLNTGDTEVAFINTRDKLKGSLNLADATFNGVALGGDRADGVAFASNVRAIYNNVLSTYAGVLSGTNLGAPLTDTEGSAKWIGSFQIRVGPSGGRAVEDFVLNISFGAGDGAGEIEALIQNDLHYPSDHHITGEFDDAGVITGTVQHGYYRTNDADNRGRAWRTGKLTGLIGEEGAVGAFVMSNYYGGFVARPSSADELRTLEQTCGDDPYNPLCTIGYESERLELIEHCITDDNVNDERCASVNKLTHCIKNPFRSDCEESLPQHHELALANRIAFCRKAENVNDALCTYSYTVQYICTRHPFSPQCFADSRYNQARQNACTTAGTGSTECRTLAGLTCGTNPFSSYCGGEYNNVRETACRNGSTNTQCGGIISGICGGNPFDTLCGSGYTQNRRNACLSDPFATRCAGDAYNDLRVSFCENNAGNPACPTPEPTTPQVTASVWADSFDEDLAHAPTAEDTESKFLIGRATDLDTGGRSPYSNSPNRSGNLNLADATFNGVALGGDRADGVAFFGAERANNGKLYSYVGILEGTNLGAPLTDTEGSAKWVGAFQVEGHSPVDFVLKVSFGTGAGAGEIEAIVERQNSFYEDIHIAGEFDDAGVITGTVRQSPNNRRRHHTTGELTGLIGQEGAIGAFVINNGWSYDYFGVFVARPSSAEELRTVEQICTDDPFIPLCATSYEAERNAIIEHCIIGDNANDEERCGSADEWYPCIVVPFGWKCDEMNYNVSQYHEQVRTNRVAFCLTPGNADNRLCTFARHHICTNYPFDAQCIDRDYYAQFRRAACADAPFAPRCAGEGYNDLRLSFCRRNAGNPACPPPPEPEIQHASGHVTATVWTDSFDEGELAAKATRTDTVSKFLKGRSGDLDTGGIGLLAGGNVNYSGTLTLAGTYNNGDSMDGDAADGIAFFAADQVNGRFLSYAGILSGTDLGAPVTQTQGTAQWLGSFQYEGYSATDFTLNILFGGGDEAGLINTIIKDYASNDFHVAGSFDDTGVITGNVYLGTFNANQDPITQGTIKHTAELTGLIGQQGAVGAFVGHTSSTTGFAGGFVAAPDAEGRTVSTSDWLASFDTEPFSIPIDTKNQFLKATAYGFNLAEMQGFSRTRQQLAVLTLADNFADGASLGGHAADGVAFFGKTITSENNNRYYSGILANTDLGLPLEPEGTPIYEWKGVFQAIGVNALKTDFTLTVTYTGGNYAGEIEAFINRSGNYYYHIQGNFNHGGVIVNGTADYGQYTDGDRDDPIALKRQTGVLSGLIGQEGAIGAFITTGGGIGGYYYSSGGFVAVPNRPDLPTPAPDTTTNRVTTEDWVASFETAPSIAPTDYRHQFVQGSETGLYTGNISVGRKWLSGPRRFYTETIDSVIFDDVRVDSDATGGFSFFQGTNGVWFYNYAGILAGTDLGAPLTQTTGSARWNGVFTSKDASYGYKKRDFVLRITFGGQEHAGTLNGYVQKDRFGEHYLVEGYFDDNGVIGGTVAEWFKGSYTPNIARLENNNQHNSKLTGLIGSRGAVAAFTGKRFVGGFIASPDIELSSEVTERDWRESFNDKVLTLDGTRDDVGLSAFIQDGDQNRIAAATPKGVLTINGVPNTNDDEVGVKFFAVMMDGRSRHYAGIFINTRLGNPLTVLPAVNGNPVTATWNGQLGIVANNSGVTIRDMNLSVDFTNQTISHSSVLNTGLKSISLDGTWTDNGLINGTITYDPNPVLNAVNARDGVVRGLIGEYGAVGAFISNDDVTDTPFAGGFVATPPE